MKKAYETPSVEMIAFRYRDQVVAASGGNPTDPNASTGSNRGDAINGFVDQLFNGAGWSACDTIGDIAGKIWG